MLWILFWIIGPLFILLLLNTHEGKGLGILFSLCYIAYLAWTIVGSLWNAGPVTMGILIWIIGPIVMFGCLSSKEAKPVGLLLLCFYIPYWFYHWTDVLVYYVLAPVFFAQLIFIPAKK